MVALPLSGTKPGAVTLNARVRSTGLSVGFTALPDSLKSASIALRTSASVMPKWAERNPSIETGSAVSAGGVVVAAGAWSNGAAACARAATGGMSSSPPMRTTEITCGMFGILRRRQFRRTCHACQSPAQGGARRGQPSRRRRTGQDLPRQDAQHGRVETLGRFVEDPVAGVRNDLDLDVGA